ncbi:MAG: hypothetical protein JJT81_19010 [Rubellimicrobium sp.]|nr:hypothetical protein [Rubellimicrobium sp.]
MKHATLTVLTVCGALAGTVPVLAEDGRALPSATDTFAPYGSFGGWNVFVNETRGTCFAERPSETSVLQMGITDPAIYAYLGVFTQAPTEAESGRVDEIELLIGEQRFVGGVTEAAGNIPGGFSGGYIVTEDPGFIEALGAGSSMTATVGTRPPIEIDLTGTADAIDALSACNAAQVG